MEEIEPHKHWRCTQSSQIVSGDLKQWFEPLGIKKMKSPIYHPKANGLASERSRQWNGPFKPGVHIWFFYLALSYRWIWRCTEILPKRGAKLLWNYCLDGKWYSQQSLNLICVNQSSKYNERVINSSSYLHYTQRNEHFIHSARELKLDSACHWQPNCLAGPWWHQNWIY